MKKVLSQPMPKDAQYIVIGEAEDPDEFPGCPDGCECPTDKGCGKEQQ
jgi:hypothetical protein